MSFKNSMILWTSLIALQRAGFLIRRSEQGFFPCRLLMVAIEQEDYVNMESSKRKTVDEKSRIVQDFLKESMKEIREIEKSTKEKNQLEAR